MQKLAHTYQQEQCQVSSEDRCCFNLRGFPETHFQTGKNVVANTSNGGLGCSYLSGSPRNAVMWVQVETGSPVEQRISWLLGHLLHCQPWALPPVRWVQPSFLYPVLLPWWWRKGISGTTSYGWVIPTGHILLWGRTYQRIWVNFHLLWEILLILVGPLKLNK